MATLDEVVSNIRQGLAATDPELDTSVGTTTRKIIDAVGESIAELYLDQHMLAYVYDVDSKTDADLDTFCQAIGGISRLAAKRATGTVVFTRSSLAVDTVFIPVNADLGSSSVPSIGVQTITGAVMLPGVLSVTVAVQAVTSGPSGNVAANSVTIIATQIEGAGSVTNIQALTGGMSQETDSELRARWKSTAFRSNAGTDPMYLGLALNDDNVTAAQVIGASKPRREQVQVASGVAQSTVDDAVFVFPTGVYVGADIDSGVLMLNGIDYTWDAVTNPPRVLITSGLTDYDTGLKDDLGAPIRASIEGAILDLDFEYTPMASRNDPTGVRFGGPAVMSRVDVWCAGQRPIAAQQSVVFQPGLRFGGASTDPYYNAKFVHLDGTNPTINNVFIPLAFGPIIAIPDVMTVGGVTYGRVGGPTVGITHANAYSLVHDDSPFGYTATSLFGLEWIASSLPATNTVFTIGGNGDYLFNDVPRSVQIAIDRWRLGGVDAQTHAAKQISLRFSLALMYERSADHSATNGNIDVAISSYLSHVGLGGVVQISDIEQAVHNVAGVDNVRFSRYADYPTWTYATSNAFHLGVQRMVNGVVAQTYVTSTGEFMDIVFGDSEVPVFDSAIKTVKAQNTFRY